MRNIHSNTFRPGPSGFAAVLFFALVVLIFPGCSEKKDTPESPPQQKSTSQEKLVIKGSNTVGEELAPRLLADYKKDHPQLVFELETKGSGSGFWGLIAGVCDIAAASRAPIKDEQQQAAVRGIELADNVIGSYSFAIIVSSNNPVSNLSREQVRDIFTGAVQNWKEVGGPDSAIHLYARNPISGTYLGFRELALEDKAYATNLTTFTNYSAIAQAIANDASGIGYAGFDAARGNGVKSVSIGGVSGSFASVNEGKYPFARALHLYINKDKENAQTRDFIQFVQSSRGQKILEQTGFVPKP